MTNFIGLCGDNWNRIVKSIKLGSWNINRCLINFGFPCLLVWGKPSSRNGHKHMAWNLSYIPNKLFDPGPVT